MTAPYVIFGAHGGVGQALAEKMAGQGHDLVLTSRNTNDLSGMPGKHYALDVLDEKSRKATLDQIASDYEKIAGVAYCIGSIVMKPFAKASEDDFRQCFDLNCMGAVHCLQALTTSLKKGGGSVVLFSTVAAQQGFPNHAVIASAKGAVESLTRSLAADWAPDIRVNAIAPSLTDTGIARPVTESEQMAKGVAAMHPIPRLGKPEDHAGMAAYLLGDEAEWITGQIFNVDGGRSSLRVKG